MNHWDRRWIELAQHYAGWSKDPSTAVGCVIASGKKQLGQGFNGFPPGIADNDQRLQDRDTRLALTIHAEINALACLSPGQGVGATLYVWPMPPCAHCAARIIQVGIVRVVAPSPPREQAERWHQSLMLSSEVLREAGVSLETVQICP